MTDQQLDAIAEAIAERVADKLRDKLAVKWVTRDQYAQAMSLGVRTVDRMVKEGRVRFKKEGTRVLIEAP